MMFSKALKERRPWNFVLQDYNDIFNLVTVPNLFLTWYVAHHPEATDEIKVTDTLKQQFLSTLKQIGIEFKFLVGAWGPSLLVLPCDRFKRFTNNRNTLGSMTSYYPPRGFIPLFRFRNLRVSS